MPLKEALDSLNPEIIVRPHTVERRTRYSEQRRDSFGVKVVRDDLLEAGTKQRALAMLVLASNATHFVYAGPCEGYAQVALGYVTRLLGRQSTVVLPRQRHGRLHALTRVAQSWGATVVQVSPTDKAYGVARLKEVQARAAAFVRQHNDSTHTNQESMHSLGTNVAASSASSASIIPPSSSSAHPATITPANARGIIMRRMRRSSEGIVEDLNDEEGTNETNAETNAEMELLPFGLHCELFVAELARCIRKALPPALQSPEDAPERLWLVAGSATLLASFARVWPTTKFMVVQVGKKIWPDQLGIDEATGARTFESELFVAPERFSEVAKCQPPYPTVRTYDAKLWQFVESHGQEGDYVWNVGRDRDV